jgi:ribosomal protein S18 acetylase RimI-like enzyme
VDIRRATLADEAVMRTLWDEFTEDATYTPYPGTPFSPSLLVDQIAFVAESDGVPAGCVYANPSDHYGFVFGLYVRCQYRGRGHAQELMRAVAEALQRDGKKYIVLSVHTPNAGARSFYEKLGLVDAARTLRAEVETLLE